MVREFKFRVWIYEKKVMRYLQSIDLSTYDDGDMRLGFCPEEVYWTGKKWKKPQFELMQWTGLKDKNDKDIYEGDIVKTALGNKAYIGFYKGGFYLMIKYESSDEPWRELNHYYDYKKKCINLEVIGNIFENPELLKEGGE